MERADPLFKVVKVPTAYGVCEGIQGEVLDEVDTRIVADSIRYQKWCADESPFKGLLYYLDVIQYIPLKEIAL